ncbi:hypothetical protein ABK040_013860 [Willaertia magna]
MFEYGFSLSLLFLSFLIYFRIGIFLGEILFKTNKTKLQQSFLSRCLFSIIISNSFLMFQFVIGNLFKIESLIFFIKDEEFKIQIWTSLLILKIILLVIILPIIQIYNIIKNIINITKRNLIFTILLILIIYTLIISLIHYITNIDFILKEENNNNNYLSIYLFGIIQVKEIIARICIIGISLIAVLSGFSAVDFTMNNFISELFFKKNEMDMEHVKIRFKKTMELILNKKRKIMELEINLSNEFKYNQKKNVENNNSSFGFFSYFNGFIPFGKTSKYQSEVEKTEQEILKLNNEVISLEELSEELYFELYGNKIALKKLEYSKTWKGRIVTFTFYLFSLYCLYKIIFSSLKVLLVAYEEKKHDPMVRLLMFLQNFTTIDLIAWSQQLSFIFIFVIILLSTRSLLLNLQKVFRAFFRSVSPSSVILFFSIVTGVYLLSLLILLKNNLSAERREILSHMIGSVAYQYSLFFKWFDTIFVAFAFVTLIFKILFRTQLDSQLAELLWMKSF